MILSRSCRIHDHGSFQSSRITRRVSGIDFGVSLELRRGAKEGDG